MCDAYANNRVLIRQIIFFCWERENEKNEAWLVGNKAHYLNTNSIEQGNENESLSKRFYATDTSQLVEGNDTQSQRLKKKRRKWMEELRGKSSI